MPASTNHVAVVAGATRGAGRGIARILDEAGAIVYGTGRSSRAPTWFAWTPGLSAPLAGA